jgi:translation initiation factor 3 subunit A
MEVLDTEKLLQLQSKQIEKEQREVAERLRIIAKRVDHLERAFRKEERPLVEADYERQKAEDKEAHVAAIKAARQVAREKHAIDLDLKKRLGRMMPDYLQARSVVESKRADEFAQRKAEAEKKMAEEKAKYKKKVLAERAAEKKRRAEEEARRAEEERVAAGEFGGISSRFSAASDARDTLPHSQSRRRSRGTGEGSS